MYPHVVHNMPTHITLYIQAYESIPLSALQVCGCQQTLVRSIHSKGWMQDRIIRPGYSVEAVKFSPQVGIRFPVCPSGHQSSRCLAKQLSTDYKVGVFCVRNG